MRVFRSFSETGWWEMVTQQPAAPLRGVVRTYVGYRENSFVPVRRREVPTGEVALIMSFGPKIEVIGGHRHSSFVAAVADTWSDTEYVGEQYGFEIMISPLGASRLLGLPLDELTGSVVELEDLLGVKAALLIEQLAGLPDWPSRFALVDSVLPRWLDEGRAPPPLVEYAWQRITGTDGRIPIGTLVDELGCSRRYLLGQFRAHVGVPPKSLARVLRCRHAMRLLTAGGRSIADIAQECGYYDHSHLDRDFKLITGVVPAQIPFFLADLPAPA
nr:helix-turn-helix transcriptional regulator [Kibdelosporangium sp. MJ126-NF4]CEL16847.1 Transcriptional regulator, AraC family [Kibdelosporangium sp. MJ126-NF4]CTQ91925.1 Transcriptional regulator, AraC family [Kibdelosporangium sp. MJ126-NF4]